MINLIEEAFETHIQALTAEPRVAWWGRPYEPDPVTPYIAVRISGSAAMPIGFGENAPELWQGMLQILVAHPTKRGPKGGRERAVVVRDHFPRGLGLVAGTSRVKIETRSIMPLVEAPDFLNYPVIIGWFCEELPT